MKKLINLELHAHVIYMSKLYKATHILVNLLII